MNLAQPCKEIILSRCVSHRFEIIAGDAGCLHLRISYVPPLYTRAVCSSMVLIPDYLERRVKASVRLLIFDLYFEDKGTDMVCPLIKWPGIA
jgi:hypothetical protein